MEMEKKPMASTEVPVRVDNLFLSSFKNLYLKPNKSCSNFCLLWECRKPEIYSGGVASIQVQVIDLEGVADNPKNFVSDFKFDTTLAWKRIRMEKGNLYAIQANNYYATSCHGLVCISNTHQREEIYVMNPITKFVLRFPPPQIAERFSSSCICIGFLPSKNQYKIVSWQLLSRVEIGCEIMTLIDTSDEHLGSCSSSLIWKKGKSYSYGFQVHYVSTCVDGVMYWLVFDDSHMKIMAFDLENEEVTIIPAPPVVDSSEFEFDGFRRSVINGRIRMSLTELRGCLCLVYETNIWLLLKEELESGPSYRWAPKITMVSTTIHAPSEELYQAAKNDVRIWNAECEKFQYLLVNEENEKPINRYGDDDVTKDGGNLVLMSSVLNRTTLNYQKTISSGQILFQGSSFSHNQLDQLEGHVRAGEKRNRSRM